MGYDSVDKLQNVLATEVFHYAKDRKKAAGRALGTFVELITYVKEGLAGGIYMNTSKGRITDAAGRNVNSLSQHWCTPEK